MLLWTIQHRAAYETLQRDGVLRANEQAESFACGGSFQWAYDWMAEQLKLRVGAPPDGVRYPIWAWYQWEGCRKRPDMRTGHRVYSEKGTPICLLTIDVPDDLVLLSDFDMWHSVLNHSYLALTEAEYDDPHAGTDNEPYDSWQRIFNWQREITPYWDIPPSTQAVFWELKAAWVKKVEFFVSK